MKLRIADQSFTFDSNEKGIKKLFEKVNSVLASSEDRYISHFVIDGEEVFGDYENYIQTHLDNINEVYVVTQTFNEFIDNLVASLYEYTNRGIPEIENLVNDFYQLPTEKSWYTLVQLIEGIEWIYHSIKSIDRTNHEIENWIEFEKTSAIFETELPHLLEAVENKDTVLIADIIQYEILPRFQKINSEIRKVLK